MALEHDAGAALTHVALKSLVYGCISTRADYLLSPCSNLVDHQGIEPCPPLRPLWVFVQQEPSWPKMEDRENFEISTRGLKARRSASELPVHDRHGIGGPCGNQTHPAGLRAQLSHQAAMVHVLLCLMRAALSSTNLSEGPHTLPSRVAQGPSSGPSDAD